MKLIKLIIIDVWFWKIWGLIFIKKENEFLKENIAKTKIEVDLTMVRYIWIYVNF